MITYFNGGINRVWHRSSAFKEGLDVKIRLWTPDFVELPIINLQEFKEGLYWFEFDFKTRGTWIGIVYEDGKKVTSNTFHVDVVQPGVISHKRL